MVTLKALDTALTAEIDATQPFSQDPSIWMIDLESILLAHGHVVLGTVVAGNKVTINGYDFTATAGTPTSAQFKTDADSSVVAANLANAITNSTDPLIDGIVTATSLNNVVTVTAVTTDAATGNALTFTAVGAPLALTPTTGTLSNGVDTATAPGTRSMKLTLMEPSRTIHGYIEQAISIKPVAPEF